MPWLIFFLRLGLEEIPARMIAAAEAELGRRVTDLLTRERLLEPAPRSPPTPRRAAWPCWPRASCPRRPIPKSSSPAPRGKWRSKTARPRPRPRPLPRRPASLSRLSRKLTTPKGEYVGATVKRPGRTATEILAAELPKEVLALYWAKNMYWRAGKPERSVRPVRWVVALLDSAVVPLEIAGIAGRQLQPRTSRAPRRCTGRDRVGNRLMPKPCAKLK